MIPNQACPSEKPNECKGKKNIESKACDEETFGFIHVQREWSLYRPGAWRSIIGTTKASWSTSRRHFLWDAICSFGGSRLGVDLSYNQSQPICSIFVQTLHEVPRSHRYPVFCVNLSAEKRKPHTFVALDPFKHGQDPRLDKAALGTLNTRLNRDLRASIGQGSLRAVKRRLQYEHICAGLV